MSNGGKPYNRVLSIPHFFSRSGIRFDIRHFHFERRRRRVRINRRAKKRRNEQTNFSRKVLLRVTLIYAPKRIYKRFFSHPSLFQYKPIEVNYGQLR